MRESIRLDGRVVDEAPRICAQRRHSRPRVPEAEQEWGIRAEREVGAWDDGPRRWAEASAAQWPRAPRPG